MELLDLIEPGSPTEIENLLLKWETNQFQIKATALFSQLFTALILINQLKKSADW